MQTSLHRSTCASVSRAAQQLSESPSATCGAMMGEALAAWGHSPRTGVPNVRRGARVKLLGGPLWVKPWQRGDSSRQAEIRLTCVEGQGGPWCRRRCSRGVGQGVRPVSLDPRRTGRPPVRVIPHGAGGLQAVRLRGRHRKASGPGLSTAPVRLEWPVSERQTGQVG